MRDLSRHLDEAVKRELVSVPSNLSNMGRLRAWATRPIAAMVVQIKEGTESVQLRAFVPGS